VVPRDSARSRRDAFREWILPQVFRDAVRGINNGIDGQPWLTDRQPDDLRAIDAPANRTLPYPPWRPLGQGTQPHHL
jgi:type I restriction enzyme R subunit